MSKYAESWDRLLKGHAPKLPPGNAHVELDSSYSLTNSMTGVDVQYIEVPDEFQHLFVDAGIAPVATEDCIVAAEPIPSGKKRKRKS